MSGGGRNAHVWNVLVVDDEADLRALVRLTLEFEDDLRVIATAANPEEAVRAAAEVRPDLVILDQMLGGRVTGLQVADTLRAEHPDARVIIFSAADDAIDLREGRVDAFVPKMDINELPAIIRSLRAPDPA